MKVVCRDCGSKAIIQSSKRETVDYSKLYCSCSDPTCGHTFVVDLSYSHSLSPSSITAKGLINTVIAQLDKASQLDLIEQLRSSVQA